MFRIYKSVIIPIFLSDCQLNVFFKHLNLMFFVILNKNFPFFVLPKYFFTSLFKFNTQRKQIKQTKKFKRKLHFLIELCFLQFS